MEEGNPLALLLQILFLPFIIIGRLLSSIGSTSSQRILLPARTYNRITAPREYITSLDVVERESYQPQQQAVKPSTIILPQQQPQIAYENKEEWDIDWTPDGLPRKIIVTRHAVQK